MNLEEKDIEIFKKLDSNVYLTFNDKQALKSGLDELDRRLQERERRLQEFSGVLLEKDGHVRVRDARIDERDRRVAELAQYRRPWLGRGQQLRQSPCPSHRWHCGGLFWS